MVARSAKTSPATELRDGDAEEADRRRRRPTPRSGRRARRSRRRRVTRAPPRRRRGRSRRARSAPGCPAVTKPATTGMTAARTPVTGATIPIRPIASPRYSIVIPNAPSDSRRRCRPADPYPVGNDSPEDRREREADHRTRRLRHEDDAVDRHAPAREPAAEVARRPRRPRRRDRRRPSGPPAGRPSIRRWLRWRSRPVAVPGPRRLRRRWRVRAVRRPRGRRRRTGRTS